MHAATLFGLLATAGISVVTGASLTVEVSEDDYYCDRQNLAPETLASWSYVQVNTNSGQGWNCAGTVGTNVQTTGNLRSPQLEDLGYYYVPAYFDGSIYHACIQQTFKSVGGANPSEAPCDNLHRGQ